MRNLMMCSMMTALATAGFCTIAAAAEPAYLADGKLQVPENYREWVFLTSGLDMSYSESPAMMDHSMFDNVFVNRQAYRAFLSSGHWPEQTMLVMETRTGATKGSINKSGKYQTADVMGVEIHIKDSQRFKQGWAFFVSDGTAPAQLVPTTESCYSCHQQHAAVDTTFVQFYPTLLGVAKRLKTLSSSDRP